MKLIDNMIDKFSNIAKDKINHLNEVSDEEIEELLEIFWNDYYRAIFDMIYCIFSNIFNQIVELIAFFIKNIFETVGYTIANIVIITKLLIKSLKK